MLDSLVQLALHQRLPRHPCAAITGYNTSSPDCGDLVCGRVTSRQQFQAAGVIAGKFGSCRFDGRVPAGRPFDVTAAYH